MPTIQNKLNQPVLIYLAEGRSIGLLASGSGVVDEADMGSPHLQGFIERGEIVVYAPEQPVGKRVKTRAEKNRDKPVVMKPEEEAEMPVETGPESQGEDKS